MLKAYEGTYGYKAVVLEKERYQGRVISSSYIKELMAAGKIALADRLLGYPYGVEGLVEHGKQLGRTLGFPTFNVVWPREKIAPPRGVYYSRIWVDGTGYAGITNVGVKPTIAGERRPLAETHVIGIDRDLYGQVLTVRLYRFSRGEQKFDSLDDLAAQMHRDLDQAAAYFAGGVPD